MQILTEYPIEARPIPQAWENLRREISHQAGRHAVIAGGAIRDHVLGLPIKDIDIFVLGMTAPAAKEIFNAETVEYAGVDEAKHQYRDSDLGMPVDLVFSRYDNVQEVLEHFDLGICRIAWDGDFIVTDDFLSDRNDGKITTFYPSLAGHRDRVLAKLQAVGFELGAEPYRRNDIDYLRERAIEHGYRLMHRRNGQYWLMPNRPMSLSEVADRLSSISNW